MKIISLIFRFNMISTININLFFCLLQSNFHFYFSFIRKMFMTLTTISPPQDRNDLPHTAAENETYTKVRNTQFEWKCTSVRMHCYRPYNQVIFYSLSSFSADSHIYSWNLQKKNFPMKTRKQYKYYRCGNGNWPKIGKICEISLE